VRRFLFVLVAYMAFDLADPALPGAFSFEVKDSEIEEALHTQRRVERRRDEGARPAPARDAAVQRGAPAPRPAAKALGALREPSPVWAPLPRSALFALASPRSPEDH
jgi:hypothetical protein